MRDTEKRADLSDVACVLAYFTRMIGGVVGAVAQRRTTARRVFWRNTFLDQPSPFASVESSGRSGASPHQMWAKRPPLPGQIGLIQDRKPSTSEDGLCALDVVQVESERGTAVRTKQERVANLDVDLGH